MSGFISWQTALTTTQWPLGCLSSGSLICENVSYWDLPPAGLDVRWWGASSSPCPPRNHPTPPSRSSPAGALQTPTHSTINVDNLENRLWNFICHRSKLLGTTSSFCPKRPKLKVQCHKSTQTRWAPDSHVRLLTLGVGELLSESVGRDDQHPLDPPE